MKLNVDIDNIVEQLEKSGYNLSEPPIERENNGKNWQLKFSNSPLTATIYDTNRKGNTVIQGQGKDNEKVSLKELIENIRWNKYEVPKLSLKIQELIASRQESSTHDFKEMWHVDNGSLLHDILCLANNLAHQEAYLIVGVSDDYEVLGLEQQKETNNFHDWFRPIKFAGGEAPDIKLEHLNIQGKCVDVLVIRESDQVPFYLSERYEKVNANQIYTRHGDTNTPINEEANKSEIEKLWYHRFGNRPITL